ncbi:MAG: DUF4180 domain-containing protein [Bacillota bacterium]
MEINIGQAKGRTYVEGKQGCLIVQEERDVLDLLAECGQNDTQLLMLHHENINPDFFDLKTGFAGTVLQKFSTYYMKAALVVDMDRIKSERFKELIYECNKGGNIRFCKERSEAEDWLVSG